MAMETKSARRYSGKMEIQHRYSEREGGEKQRLQMATARFRDTDTHTLRLLEAEAEAPESETPTTCEPTL